LVNCLTKVYSKIQDADLREFIESILKDY